MNMHIYTNEEYLKKQQAHIKKQTNKFCHTQICYKKSSVIKNYIYYEQPIKLLN